MTSIGFVVGLVVEDCLFDYSWFLFNCDVRSSEDTRASGFLDDSAVLRRTKHHHFVGNNLSTRGESFKPIVGSNVGTVLLSHGVQNIV
jgi:hypothetical protein